MGRICWLKMHVLSRVPTLFVRQVVDLKETFIFFASQIFRAEILDWKRESGGAGCQVRQWMRGDITVTGCHKGHSPHAELPHCLKMLRSIWLNKIVVQYNMYRTPGCPAMTIQLVIIQLQLLKWKSRKLHPMYQWEVGWNFQLNCNFVQYLAALQRTCWCTTCAPCLFTS